MLTRKLRTFIVALVAVVVISACGTSSSPFNVRLIDFTVSNWELGAAQLRAFNSLNFEQISTGTISESGVMDLTLPANVPADSLDNTWGASLALLLLLCPEGSVQIDLGGANVAIIDELQVDDSQEFLVNATLSITPDIVSVAQITRIFSDRAIQVSATCTFSSDGVSNTITLNINAPQGWSLLQISGTGTDTSAVLTLSTVSSTNLPWRLESELFGGLSATQERRLQGFFQPREW